MSRYRPSFSYALHYYVARFSEPALHAEFGPHVDALAELERELDAAALDATSARRIRDRTHHAVQAASRALDGSLEPLCVALVVAGLGTLARPFGPHPLTPGKLRKARPSAKPTLARGLLAGRMGVSAALDAAVQGTLDATVAVERALDAATEADVELLRALAHRNDVSDRAQVKLRALRRYAELAAPDASAISFLSRPLPSLVRAGHRRAATATATDGERVDA